MGAEISQAAEYQLNASIQCLDEIDLIEVVSSAGVLRRLWPAATPARQPYEPPVLIRFEWGWGPWGELALERITDWQFNLRVRNGRLRRA